jgi:hypothetical protein
VEQHPFPGPGHDGDVPPLPGGPVQDGVPGGTGSVQGMPADDWDGDAEMAAFLADVEAGRARIPEPWELEGPAATISLGDACDVELAELAAMAGPDGLGGDRFAAGGTADAMRPGPVLAALTEQAAGELNRLSDNQVLGLVSAARRLANRAEYLELAGIAEFTRRRAAQFEGAKARKEPRGCRDGEFADAELAMELLTSVNAARDRMDLAADLATRQPETFAGMAAGVIDGDRAWVIWCRTRFLSGEKAAQADKVLAAAAPGLRYDQLARKAAALEMRLDPEGVKRRKEQARREDQRIEARREHSGNAALAGRELATEDVLASKAHIDALAAALRAGGLEGSLRQLRVLVYLDLTQGRDPLARLTHARRHDSAAGKNHSGQDNETHGRNDHREDDDDYRDDDGGDDEDRDPEYYRDDEDEQEQGGEDGRGYPDGEDGGGSGSGPAGPADLAGHIGGQAPLPALINLIVPAGTLLGWSGAPGDAGTWGLTDPDDTRRLVAAASMHPRTRWCVTVTGPDGTAAAHGCARGPRPWTPAPGTSPLDRQAPGGGGRDGPATTRDGTNPRDGTSPPGPGGSQSPAGPDAGQAAQLEELLHRLNVTLAPIAKGTCDHRHKEDRYTPSRKLQHLVRARTTRCAAPGCDAQAYYCDLDHTASYPEGLTCQCGLGPVCRRHHRCKQAPGWHLEQPEPGIMRWTTPSGRIYTTTPTKYGL